MAESAWETPPGTPRIRLSSCKACYSPASSPRHWSETTSDVTPPRGAAPRSPLGLPTPCKASLPPRGACLPSPPRLRRCSLLEALQNDDLEEVALQLDLDETLVHVPLRNRGCQPPVLAALQEGCSVSILDLLLRRGANVDATSNGDITALEAVASSRPAWSVESISEVDSYDQIHTMLAPVSMHSISVSMQDQEPPWLRQDPDCEKEGVGNRGFSGLRMMEEHCCAYSACLLSHGANPRRLFGQGLSAVERVENSDRAALTTLLRYWTDWQVCRWLRHLGRKAPAERLQRKLSTDAIAGILHCPPDVSDLICGFLAPPEERGVR